MSVKTRCPRCTKSITCHANDIAACPCNNVVVSDRLKNFLKNTSYDCLCNNCLSELSELLDRINDTDSSINNKELKKGLHYYIDKGNYVFTEYYHIQRGSCCGNHCRHCAYGLKPST